MGYCQGVIKVFLTYPEDKISVKICNSTFSVVADAYSGEGKGLRSLSINNFTSYCQEEREGVGWRTRSGRQRSLTVKDDVSPLYKIMDSGITCHRVKDHPDRHFAACQGESSVGIY